MENIIFLFEIWREGTTIELLFENISFFKINIYPKNKTSFDKTWSLVTIKNTKLKTENFFFFQTRSSASRTPGLRQDQSDPRPGGPPRSRHLRPQPLWLLDDRHRPAGQDCRPPAQHHPPSRGHWCSLRVSRRFPRRQVIRRELQTKLRDKSSQNACSALCILVLFHYDFGWSLTWFDEMKLPLGFVSN